jgi:hypothetical protein
MSVFNIGLISDDERLASRIRAAFRTEGEHLTRLTSRKAALQGQYSTLVIDCRRLPREAVEGLLSGLREEGRYRGTVVALVDCRLGRVLEAFGSSGPHVTELLLMDSDEIGAVVRALAAATELSWAAAVALSVLGPELKVEARRVVTEVLASGFAIRTVHEVARVLGLDSDTLGTRLKCERSPTPSELIAMAKAAFAVVAHRECGATRKWTMSSLQVSDRATVAKLLERGLGIDLMRVMSDSAEMEIEHFLRSLIHERLLRGAHRSGPASLYRVMG